MGIRIAGGFVAIQRPVHSQPRIRIECALNPVLRASTRNAHLRKRILMRITQSTSVGGLNLYWFIDCEAREMAGCAWSVEETRALLNLWEDDRVQRQLEGSWKLFLTVGLCPHTLQISYDGRAVDRNDIPPAHSSHQRSAYAFMHVIMLLFIGDSASSVRKLYTNVTRPFPPRSI